MYLFVDTETTGLPDNYNSLSSYWNVRLVQIAWMVFDKAGRKISKRDFIIKPEGFEIPDSATRIHKISTSLALSCGKSLAKVLAEFNNAQRTCTHIVAHNLNFDRNVLLSECNRVRASTDFQNLEKICTMESTTDYCAIITSMGNKWPSLSELYKKVFNADLVESHNAVVDIEATAKCFWYLKKHNLVSFTNSNNEIRVKSETIGNTHRLTPKIIKIVDVVKKSAKSLNIEITKPENMNLRECAISLKSYCESIKDGDSVSKKQLERLYELVDSLILLIDESESGTDDDWPETTSSNKESVTSNKSYSSGDLPF